MSDEIKINRVPNIQSQKQDPAQPAITPLQVQPEVGEKTKMNFKKHWFILAGVVLVLIVLAVLFREKMFMKKNQSSQVKGVTVGASSYQAVFLTNGQVYFGKLASSQGEYLTLQDIYYLQVVQPPLQGQLQPNQPSPSTPEQPQISLIKLGSELHGPEDEMHISKAQVLFYESLKESGQVVQAIVTDKNKPK